MRATHEPTTIRRGRKPIPEKGHDSLKVTHPERRQDWGLLAELPREWEGKAILAWLTSLKKMTSEENGRAWSLGPFLGGVAHLNRAEIPSLSPLASYLPSSILALFSSLQSPSKAPLGGVGCVDMGLHPCSHLCVDALRFCLQETPLWQEEPDSGRVG